MVGIQQEKDNSEANIERVAHLAAIWRIYSEGRQASYRTDDPGGKGFPLLGAQLLVLEGDRAVGHPFHHGHRRPSRAEETNR